MEKKNKKMIMMMINNVCTVYRSTNVSDEDDDKSVIPEFV